MKYYDARIIEGCCVFSYTVETPAAQTEKNIPSQKKIPQKQKQNQNSFWKKIFFPLFFLCLAPFALLIDAVCLIGRKTVSLFRCVLGECASAGEPAACIIVAVSSSVLIPLVLLIL